MQVFFLYYFRSILLFINTLIASAYIELTLINVELMAFNGATKSPPQTERARLTTNSLF